MKWICLSLIAIVSIYQRNKVVKSLKKSDALDWFAFMRLVFPGQDWSTYETKVAGKSAILRFFPKSLVQETSLDIEM